MSFYRNRWYDSNLSRLISEDPIGLAGGINQFGYVGGNPVGFTDPSGLERYSLEQYRGDWNREKPVQPIDIDLDRIQIVLGVLGMIPGFGEPFDLIDGTICLLSGDYVGASLSATSAIPLFGTSAGIVKVTNRIGKVDNLLNAKNLDSVPLVNGRKPINSQYAGGTHPSGVRFNEQGFPDFSPFSKAQVDIKGLTGNYAKDSAMANKAIGLESTPDGYLWHHVENGKTMQLIPRDIHNATRHTGGAAILRNQYLGEMFE